MSDEEIEEIVIEDVEVEEEAEVVVDEKPDVQPRLGGMPPIGAR